MIEGHIRQGVVERSRFDREGIAWRCDSHESIAAGRIIKFLPGKIPDASILKHGSGSRAQVDGIFLASGRSGRSHRDHRQAVRDPYIRRAGKPLSSVEMECRLAIDGVGDIHGHVRTALDQTEDTFLVSPLADVPVWVPSDS